MPFFRFFWDEATLGFLACSTLFIAVLTLWEIVKHKHEYNPNIPKTLILFAFFFILSSIGSVFHKLIFNQSILLFSAMILFIYTQRFSSASKSRVLKLFCGGAILYSVLYLSMTVIQVHLLRKAAHLPETIEFFLNENVVASFFLLGLGASAELRKSERLLGTLSFSLCFAGLIATRSVGAWVGALCVLALFHSERIRKIKLPFAAAMTLFLVFFVWGARFFMSLDSVQNRAHWWKSSLELIQQRPALGFGPGTYEAASSRLPHPGMKSIYAHNFFLQTSAELGVPAAVIIFVFFMLETWRQRKNFLAFGASAVFIQNLFDFSLSVPGIFLAAFAFLGMARNPEASTNPE